MFILGWLVCGFLGYGLTLAYFQRKFTSIAEMQHASDVMFAVFIGICGPVGLMAALVAMTNFNHPSWEPIKSSNPIRYGFKIW